jgi:hypothetical protein
VERAKTARGFWVYRVLVLKRQAIPAYWRGSHIVVNSDWSATQRRLETLVNPWGVDQTRGGKPRIHCAASRIGLVVGGDNAARAKVASAIYTWAASTSTPLTRDCSSPVGYGCPVGGDIAFGDGDIVVGVMLPGQCSGSNPLSSTKKPIQCAGTQNNRLATTMGWLTCTASVTTS